MITSSIIFVVRLSDMLFAFSLKSCCYETGLSNEYCRLQGRSAEMCRSLGHVVADTPVDALTHARVHGRTTRGQELTTDHRMVFEPERPGTDWGREGDRASTTSSTNSCANWRKGDRAKMQRLSFQEFRLWALEARLLALRQSAGSCTVCLYG